jgi:hypothetical protein
MSQLNMFIPITKVDAGATSVTDVIVKQRIESYIAAALCSQTLTVQAQAYNSTGGAITPLLTVSMPVRRMYGRAPRRM